MNESLLWLVKVLLAHLLTDFVFQPTSWVISRKENHFASVYLYIHGILTGIVALILAGFNYWLICLIITVTHILIDGWKSYMPDKVKYFLLDQALHLLVIVGCWFTVWSDFISLREGFDAVIKNEKFWIIATAFTFLSFPAGILIGQLTKKWREQLSNAEGLADAGKWIGILERTIILILLLKEQYQVIGLLIAAKSILRFNEKERQEAKTEYVVIGSLMSIGMSLLTGIIVRSLIS